MRIPGVSEDGASISISISIVCIFCSRTIVYLDVRLFRDQQPSSELIVRATMIGYEWVHMSCCFGKVVLSVCISYE